MENPDPFRGTRSASEVENCIFSIDQYFDIMPMTPTHQVAFAINLLRDDASLWWHQFGVRRQEQDDIAD